ncbi:DUF2431 domain-containing protein [Chlamydiia bacterium]|nr:DUF2431 domain-containing protein [Chlamydiia bacterium]
MTLVKRKKNPALSFQHLGHLGLEQPHKKRIRSTLNHLDLAGDVAHKENTITIENRPVILYLGCANFIDARADLERKKWIPHALATTFNTLRGSETQAKYKRTKVNIRALRTHGVSCFTGVDATKVHRHPLIKKWMNQHNVTGFDKVKFFFPYAPKSTQSSPSSNSLNDCIKRQQTLIAKTFTSVMHILKPNGVFIVNGYINREQYYTPNIEHAELTTHRFDNDGCLEKYGYAHCRHNCDKALEPTNVDTARSYVYRPPFVKPEITPDISPALRGFITGQIQAAKSYTIRSKKDQLRINIKELLNVCSYRAARDIYSSKIKNSFDQIDDDIFLDTLIQIITDKNQVWIGLLEDKPEYLNQWKNRLHERNLVESFCNRLTQKINNLDYIIDESVNTQTVLYEVMSNPTVKTKKFKHASSIALRERVDIMLTLPTDEKPSFF